MMSYVHEIQTVYNVVQDPRWSCWAKLKHISWPHLVHDYILRLHLMVTSCDYISWLLLVTTTHDYILFMTTSHSWPHLVTTSHDYISWLHLTTTSCNHLSWLNLVTTACDCIFWPHILQLFLVTAVQSFLKPQEQPIHCSDRVSCSQLAFDGLWLGGTSHRRNQICWCCCWTSYAMGSCC